MSLTEAEFWIRMIADEALKAQKSSPSVKAEQKPIKKAPRPQKKSP